VTAPTAPARADDAAPATGAASVTSDGRRSNHDRPVDEPPVARERRAATLAICGILER